MKAIAVRLLIAVLILGAVVIGFWSTQPGRLFGPQNFNDTFAGKFKFGMSEQEIEEIMGAPPGCYEGAIIRDDDELPWPKRHELNTHRMWVNRRVVVVFEFDRGRACWWRASGRTLVGAPVPQKRWWENLFD